MLPTKAKTALVIVGMQDGFASCMPKAVVDGMVRRIVRFTECVRLVVVVATRCATTCLAPTSARSSCPTASPAPAAGPSWPWRWQRYVGTSARVT